MDISTTGLLVNYMNELFKGLLVSLLMKILCEVFTSVKEAADAVADLTGKVADHCWDLLKRLELAAATRAL